MADGIQPTDTVVVSGAAGATGCFVGQLAKIMGAKRVVGIAGSAEKIEWLVNWDSTLASNTKTPTLRSSSRPDEIDVYWDNVGGDILDMALGHANVHARFVMCGGISQYNSADPKGPKNNFPGRRAARQDAGFHCPGLCFG